MSDLLKTILEADPVKLPIIKETLGDICEAVHAGCNDECPVFKLNGSAIPNFNKEESGCDCFKNASAMLLFIETKLIERPSEAILLEGYYDLNN